MKEKFSTSDFSLATTLVTLGFPVQDLDRSRHVKRVNFIFEKTADLEKAIDEFWCSGLQVEPKNFCLQQKSLKSQLYHTA